MARSPDFASQLADTVFKLGMRPAAADLLRGPVGELARFEAFARR